jgi:hypothetical protein
MSTTLAPPREPAVWGPPSPGLPPVTPEAPPSGTRRPLLLATAVVAMVALAVGAFVALTADGDQQGVTLPQAQAFDLTSAAQSAVAARTVEFDLDVTAAGMGVITMSGAIDNETKVASITTDLSSILGMGDALVGDATADVIVADGVVYFSADALGGLLPSGSPWVSIDLSAIADATGTPLEDMTGGFFLDPTAAAQMLLDADDVTTVGNETIDGVATRHYQVSVDLAAAIAAAPQLGAQLDARLDDQLAQSGIPDTIVYDVWVTEDNQLRRAAVDVTVAEQTVSMVLDMRTSAEPLGVEIPSDSFDITSWLNW